MGEDRHVKILNDLIEAKDILKNKSRFNESVQSQMGTAYSAENRDTVIKAISEAIVFLGEYELLFPDQQKERLDPVKKRKARREKIQATRDEFLTLTGLGSDMADLYKWAQTFPQLKGASDEEIRASYLLYKYLFMEPDITTKASWTRGVRDLLRAAGGVSEALEAGIKQAKELRGQGTTIANPHSVVKLVQAKRQEILQAKADKALKKPGKVVISQ